MSTTLLYFQVSKISYSVWYLYLSLPFERMRIILMRVLLNNVLTINYNLNFDFVYLVMWDNLMSELERERLERNNIRLLFCCMCSSNITIGTYHGSSNNSCTHIIKINFNLMYMRIFCERFYFICLILDHIFCYLDSHKIYITETARHWYPHMYK